jgi:hypothetical protein
MNHNRTSEEVVDWWLFRCADFVFETDGLCEGPWAFFIQAMAVKSIVRNADKDRAAGASIRLEAESEHTSEVTFAESACMGARTGCSGHAQHATPPGQAAQPTTQQGVEQTRHWQ